MSPDWMPGIRDICTHWSHAPMLQQTFATLENEFNNDSDACIDAAKGVVECACRLIITELDDPASSLLPIRNDAGLGDLLGFATRALKLGESRDRAFSNLIREHNKLAEALRVMRNEGGTVSHGKAGFALKLSAHHRRAALLAADAIITFLHEAYLEGEPDPVMTLEPFEQFSESNALIDTHSLLITTEDEEGGLLLTVKLPNREEIPLSITPAQILFGVDREAYKLALNACHDAEKLICDEAT
jgi:Abortive infection C-terminus